MSSSPVPRSLRFRIQHLIDLLESSERYVLMAMGVLLLIGVLGLGSTLVRRSLIPYRLELVAGNDTGESYILSTALAQVLRQETNLRVDVCETDGTDDNIRSLSRSPLVQAAVCQSGRVSDTLYAELGTAQADRPSGPSILPIATLYQDQFQLVIRPERFGRPPDFDTAAFQFSELNGKTIGTPEGGGQRESFVALANHYNIVYRQLDLGSPAEILTSDRLDAVFRVRNLGNAQIQALVDAGWRVVPIPQAEALQSTRYPNYQASTIPLGVYRGYPPVPQSTLETIAVDRLLVAREDVPNWVTETVTAALVENRQAIKDAVVELARDRQGTPDAFDPAPVNALVDRFVRPDAAASRPIHAGALRYYERTQPSFVQKNADFLALLVTLGVLCGSWSWRLVAWRNRRRQEQESQTLDAMKDLANTYVEQAVAIMQLDKLTGDAKTVLGELFSRLEQLNQIFRDASRSLDRELISQEGFRAFSEAYKSVREVLERAIEDRQRKFLSYYVEQVMTLLNRLQQGENPASLADELEELFRTSAISLTRDNIFSRESFRTFTEAYNVVRGAIERQTQAHPGAYRT